MSAGIRPSVDKPEGSVYITPWYILEVKRMQQILAKDEVIRGISVKDLTSLKDSCTNVISSVERELHARDEGASGTAADMVSNS